MSEKEPDAPHLHDILRDAAGHLAKLGNNLQLRADRIRQRKLSGNHSVRRVTDKVLLICDLSKNTILKVEDVIKKAVYKERNGVERSGRVEKPKLRKIGNVLVRIPKQVNLAHYESCRVRARTLPISFLDKYPIYFDCKTWRSRRERDKQGKLSDENYLHLKDQKQRTRPRSDCDAVTHHNKKIKLHSKIISDDDNLKTDSIKLDSISRTNLKSPSNDKTSDAKLVSCSVDRVNKNPSDLEKNPDKNTECATSKDEFSKTDTQRVSSLERLNKNLSECEKNPDKNTECATSKDEFSKTDTQRVSSLEGLNKNVSELEKNPDKNTECATSKDVFSKTDTQRVSSLKGLNKNLSKLEKNPDKNNECATSKDEFSKTDTQRVSSLERLNKNVSKLENNPDKNTQCATSKDEFSKTDTQRVSSLEGLNKNLSKLEKKPDKNNECATSKDEFSKTDTQRVSSLEGLNKNVSKLEKNPDKNTQSATSKDEFSKTDTQRFSSLEGLDNEDNSEPSSSVKKTSEIASKISEGPSQPDLQKDHSEQCSRESADLSDDKGRSSEKANKNVAPSRTGSSSSTRRDKCEDIFSSSKSVVKLDSKNKTLKSTSSGNHSRESMQSESPKKKKSLKRRQRISSSEDEETNRNEKSLHSDTQEDNVVTNQGTDVAVSLNGENCTNSEIQNLSDNPEMLDIIKKKSKIVPNENKKTHLTDMDKNKVFDTEKIPEQNNKQCEKLDADVDVPIAQSTNSEGSSDHRKPAAETDGVISLTEISESSKNSKSESPGNKINTPSKMLSVLTISSSDDDDVNKIKNDDIKKDSTNITNIPSNCGSICSDDETHSQKSTDSTRPLIKCIDLNKLLQSPLKEPNPLLVETHSVHRTCEESKHSRPKIKYKSDVITNSNTAKLPRPPSKPHSKPKKINTLYQSEISANQAVQLRELLVKFKPRKFNINVSKLPSFTKEFLTMHKLRHITRSGSVVATLVEESTQVNSIAKTDLLNESSDSSEKSEIRIMKKSLGEGLGKRKHMLESIRAKRMLLTYSSSSDTDDDTLKFKSKGMKDVHPKIISSGEENENCKDIKSKEKTTENSSDDLKKKSEAHKRQLLDSSSSSISDEDTIDRALNKLEKEMEVVGPNDSGVRSTKSGESESGRCEKTVKTNERASSKTSSISQVDGNDDGTTGSDSEMGRTTRSRTGASAQNSDSPDNDDRSIDGLTNLKSLHRKNKDRESPSNSSDNSKSKKKFKDSSPKTDAFKDDVLLEADSKSSSDVGSDMAEAEIMGDGSSAEDIPAASSLNGEPIGELARADLLGEDSDSTHDTTTKEESDDGSSKNNGKAKTDSKKKSRKGKPGKVIELDSTDNEDTEAEELKVRRRKQEAISSGSEAGGSEAGGSKKKKSEKDSDYANESAGSDNSAHNFKKSKRKAKKSSDSDSAGRSSSDGRKKKRRRIKQVKESEGSDESGSDNDGKKGGRKNIRKVMGKDQLEEATKKAAREERERMARIADRQKQYNNTAFDESGKPDEVKLDKVVLDYDPETKEPLIQVDPGIVKKLKPHQANGIKFMWDACFESAKQIKKGTGSGCILAHCMGLGKTLQVVSLTHTLLAHYKLTRVQRVLVVCPLSTVLNWVNEFRMWTEFAEDNAEIDIYELSRFKQNHERAAQLKEWMRTGGVCVLGYEMFRNLSADNPKKFRKKMLSTFQESLVNPGPDLVVCDEGHLLKNEKTSLSQSMNRVRTLRRIVLTGTPLQNNLKEYYCMVQFVKPNLLGKYNEYLNRFVNPITNGQYTNSTEQDIRVMKRRSHVLHKMLDGAVQRRDYGVLAPFLPPKHEYVLFITLTDVQIKLYQHYLDNLSRRQQAGGRSGFLFPDFQSLQRIWTHPLVLKANSERYEIAQQKKRDREEEEDSEGSLADFLDDDSTPEESTSEEETDVSDDSNDSRKKSKKKSSKKGKHKSEASSSRRSTRANPDAKAEELDMKALKDPDEPRAENPTEWWIRLVEEKELEDMRNSNKLVLLFHILRQCEAIGDKLLVFSQSLYSLDLIEQFLSRIDDATQMGKVEEDLGNNVGSWSPGIDYFRLDGSTSCENRSIWCKNFNREDNPRARLFLISTRAGGLGINLVAANRVVIFDVSWNPSHDVQSIFRVYRFGQKKPCYVYRFLAMGTMEEKIYERQVTKQAISKRVIDEQQIDRHYNENDLQELYTFQPRPEQPRPVPLLPRDRLFAEMLKEHDQLIYRYHEHDSLLENKEEETLTEEERKAAWEDFENEKNRPPPAPFVNPGYAPQLNGMNNLMQQQLALATMLSVLRKDYPGLSEQQVANILPQLLYADPSMYGGYDFNLMQKMRALSGMAPGMMGGMGVGAAAGGSLGFQPTWQQQQQMQLQRLQQQQAMSAAGGPGVKYYAGGLGSRDPMSMALQQKQQREMLLNSTGDRLRDMLVGAAPHAQRPPRAPPTHTAEVVNLDDSE